MKIEPTRVRCPRCGMSGTLSTDPLPGEPTHCTEPGCGRRFSHRNSGQNRIVIAVPADSASMELWEPER